MIQDGWHSCQVVRMERPQAGALGDVPIPRERTSGRGITASWNI
jgi:hypothetical protein